MRELEAGVMYKLPIKNGYLEIVVSADPDYPGLDVEYIDESDEGLTASRPRVLIECPADTKELRALIWNNPDKEDYQVDVTLQDGILPEGGAE